MGGGGKAPKPTGTTTTTSTATSQPWSVQIPYLQQGFQGAQNLYENYVPQYYPGTTVAPFADLQNAGLGTIGQTASELLGAPKWGALNSLDYLMSGQQFGNNPAVAPLMNMSGTNTGLSNPGSDVLSSLINSNSAYANPAFGTIAGTATGANLAPIGNLAVGSIAPATSTMFSGLDPAMNTLQYYASGAATPQFLGDVAKSTLANVVPSIESQFIGGGGIQGTNNPQAMRSVSEGATAALAPIIENAYQQAQQNQLAAGGALGNLGIAGGNALQNYTLAPAGFLSGLTNLATNAGLGLGNQITAGTGLQQQGAGTLGNLALQGGQLQTSQLSDVGNLYSNALQNQLMATGLFPSISQGALGIGNAMFGAGTQQQQQNQAQIQDAINRYNYYQTLPYNLLNTYQAEVGGNYGGTSTGSTSQPYYINQGANALSGGLGGALAGQALGNFLSPAMSASQAAAATPTILGLGGENLAFPLAATAGGGGLGSAIGGGIGAVLPFLTKSDRRLKTEVKRIGTAANGLPLYLFRFYGSPVKHVGVMADEVEKLRPEAVYDGPFGVKLVDYDTALS